MHTFVTWNDRPLTDREFIKHALIAIEGLTAESRRLKAELAQAKSEERA